jgi:hypothetical protein
VAIRYAMGGATVGGVWKKGSAIDLANKGGILKSIAP